MKILGAILLVVGLLMGAFALSMEVGVTVPAKNYGYGVSTPEMQVANVDRMEQRRNYMIFSAALIVGGVLLIGFAAVAPKAVSSQLHQADAPSPHHEKLATKVSAAAPTGAVAVTICPECRSMCSDSQNACRCGYVFS